MHDPRVSACLARLGGVYRDPARVDRDASCLLRSEVGSNLVPIIAEMYENNGTKFNVLVLQGTIAIHFRGTTYQILMDIYLPAGYPNRPPVPYVRLAPNMYLKEKHQHVGRDGKVYLPYLHEWRSVSHNLVEMVVAISSVFSADPPVFTRRPTATTPAVAAAAATQAATAVGNTSPKPTLRSVPPPPSPPSQMQQQQQQQQQHHSRNASRYEVDGGAMMTDEEAIQAALDLEAKELERRAMEESLRQEQERSRLEAVRLAEERRIVEESLKEQQERDRQEAARLAEERALEEEQKRMAAASAAQKEWERQRTAAVRIQVKAKIRQELQERQRKVQHIIADEIERDLNKLHIAREQKIQIPLQSLTRQKPELERQLAIAEETKRGMEAWIEQATAAANLAEEQQQSVTATVDDKVVPERPLHGQMMTLSAENAALTDALYFLDRAMNQGHLSCEVHLRQVRQLAKRQFLVRAHLIKINQQSLASGIPARH